MTILSARSEWSAGNIFLLPCCSMRNFDQAALFTESCLEYGLIRKNKKTGRHFKRTASSQASVSAPSIFTTCCPFSPSSSSHGGRLSGVCSLPGEPGSPPCHALLLQPCRGQGHPVAGGPPDAQEEPLTTDLKLLATPHAKQRTHDDSL